MSVLDRLVQSLLSGRALTDQRQRKQVPYFKSGKLCFSAVYVQLTCKGLQVIMDGEEQKPICYRDNNQLWWGYFC